VKEKITWQEMKQRYPDEWLLIVDYDLDGMGHLQTGVVKKHSRNKVDIYKADIHDESAAFRYTGESSFSGLRSHAAC
jgi:hypothetical protein